MPHGAFKKFISVFHRFRQAKFAYGGSIFLENVSLIYQVCQFAYFTRSLNFKLEPIFATVSATSKNGARFKSGQ
jgi:hypothetical protein